MTTSTEIFDVARRRLEAAGATASQVEAIRRIGAQRRHEQRVEAARVELRTLLDACAYSPDSAIPQASQLCALDRQAVGALIRRAIERSLRYIGVPGSRCGTAPPGWMAASPYHDARVSALRHAMAFDLRESVPRACDYREAGAGVWFADEARPWTSAQRPAVYVTASQGMVAILRDDEDDTAIGVVGSAAFPVLAEHMLACAIEERARDVDAWLLDQQGDMPPLPDASACAEHERLCAERRSAQ